MLGEITVNGKSSRDFNVYLSDAGVYGMPERDMENIEIPGRSGDLVKDNGRFKNVEMSFPCIIVDHFKDNFSAFVGYLLNQTGYVKIEDSFFPDEYILAKYSGDPEPKAATYGDKGTFDIKFNRKPQRYLKVGNDTISFTSNGSVYNKYNGTAKPLVRVYGTGDLAIGDAVITINSVDTYVDIDCDIQDAFKGATNCNGNISLNSGRFFELTPGVNNIAKANTISRVEITPRWWKL